MFRGLVVAGVALSVLACGTTPAPTSSSALHDDAITVASFDFPESDLLAQIYGQALRRGGYRVRFAPRLGARELVDPALERGLVELVPEYAGTTLQFHSLGRAKASASAPAVHRALVRQLGDGPVKALAASPAQNSNVIVVTRQTAASLGLRTISDLVRAAPRLVFGGPPECRVRPLCLLGLERTYGLHFRRVLALDAGGPLTHQALSQGEASVALVFSTDPRLTAEHLVVLDDDRHLQPAESVTPLVRREVVRRWGGALTTLIDGVSARLTTDELRRLNGELTDAADSPRTTAARWLTKEGVR